MNLLGVFYAMIDCLEKQEFVKVLKSIGQILTSSVAVSNTLGSSFPS